jgi:hypothetical protein
MVTHPFVQIEAHRQAESRSEIDAHCGDGQFVHGSHASIIVLRMRIWIAALVLTVMLGACSRVTQENFLKIQEGMSEQEVASLLGPPTESNSVNVLGVSGTASRWVGKDAVIVVRFVNGKVALKSFDK